MSSVGAKGHRGSLWHRGTWDGAQQPLLVIPQLLVKLLMVHTVTATKEVLPAPFFVIQCRGPRNLSSVQSSRVPGFLPPCLQYVDHHCHPKSWGQCTPCSFSRLGKSPVHLCSQLCPQITRCCSGRVCSMALWFSRLQRLWSVFPDSTQALAICS